MFGNLPDVTSYFRYIFLYISYIIIYLFRYIQKRIYFEVLLYNYIMS